MYPENLTKKHSLFFENEQDMLEYIKKTKNESEKGNCKS